MSLWLVWRKGFPGFLIEGFPFFVLRIYTVLPRMKKISRFARNDGAGHGFMRLSVIMAGFARGVPTGFPFFVLRIYTVLPQTEKISRSAIEMSLYICYIYAIYIGAVKRHRISALLPESRTRKADALPGSFTSIIYVYNIFPYAYSMEIA